MKTNTLFLAFALALIAASALAEDYSRPTLLRIVHEQQQENEPAVTFDNGAVSFTALGTRWAFLYRPMLPLAGSRPVVSQVLPDAFSLTGTELATMPRNFPKIEIEGIDFGRRGRITVRAR
jgi:hypothetical protein